MILSSQSLQMKFVSSTYSRKQISHVADALQLEQPSMQTWHAPLPSK
jgi:hypothetical protein